MLQATKLLLISFLLTLINIQISANEHLQAVTIKSASELDYPPFSITKEDGSADGFSVELLTATLHVMGRNVEFYVAQWSQIKQDLIKQKIQVLPVVGINDEREKVYDFTMPYLRMHGVVFTRENYNKINSANDIVDKELAVMEGDNAEEFLLQNDIGKKIVAYSSYEVAFKELAKGHHDAVVVQQLVGTQLIKKLKLKNIKVSDFILNDFEQKFCFAVKDGDKELLSILNEGLSIIIANGEYERIYKKWFHTIDVNYGINKNIFIAAIVFLLIALVILFIIFIWNKSLTIRVNQKTEELNELKESLENRIEKAIQDIKKKDNEIFQQSRQAQMGSMIGMIAHQWRQPLTTISAISIDLQLKSELEDFDMSIESEAKEYEQYVKDSMRNIDTNIQNLSLTIDDFRNFYNPNKLTKSMTLEDVTQRALSIIKRSLLNHNIKLNEDYQSKIHLNILENEMMQVILNILKNAQDKFILQKTKEPCVEITTTDYAITIFDNGTHIDNHDIENIFDPYFSTKDEKNGTGLGLHLAKIIVEEHHRGKFTVENTPRGVCFKIELDDQGNTL